MLSLPVGEMFSHCEHRLVLRERWFGAGRRRIWHCGGCCRRCCFFLSSASSSPSSSCSSSAHFVLLLLLVVVVVVVVFDGSGGHPRGVISVVDGGAI